MSLFTQVCEREPEKHLQGNLRMEWHLIQGKRAIFLAAGILLKTDLRALPCRVLKLEGRLWREFFCIETIEYDGLGTTRLCSHGTDTRFCTGTNYRSGVNLRQYDLQLMRFSDCNHVKRIRFITDNQAELEPYQDHVKNPYHVYI